MRAELDKTSAGGAEGQGHACQDKDDTLVMRELRACLCVCVCASGWRCGFGASSKSMATCSSPLLLLGGGVRKPRQKRNPLNVATDSNRRCLHARHIYRDEVYVE